MAAKNDNWKTETVVIQAGPTFGQALSFMMLGAVLGAAATYSVLRNGEISARAEFDDSLRATEKNAAQLQNRLGRLSSRVKNVAVFARDAAQSWNEHVRPALQGAMQDAVQEGKTAARVTSELLEDDLRRETSTKKPFDDLAIEEA